jgi:hypothetical protein
MSRLVPRANGAWRIVLSAGLLLAAPAVALARQAPGGSEIVAEIRIHGNYATSDADVLKIAGLTPGQPLEAGTIPEVEARLRRSGRFD